MVLDPEAVSNGARVLVDPCLKRGHAPGQVLSSGVAMVVGDVLAQPAPECLHRHQVGTVAGQRRKRDAEAGGFGSHHLGPVIGCAVPDNDEPAVGELGAEPVQHVDCVLAIGARVGPDPHLAFVEEVKAVERYFGRQPGRGGRDMEPLAALAPAMAKVHVLVDVSLIEVDQPVPVALGAIQQGAQLFNKGCPPSEIGTAKQLPGLLP